MAAGTTPSADSATDWESIIAADGSGSRPAARRTRDRSRSVMSASTPSFFHRAQNPYTVRQGGKSAGSARHLIPLSTR